MTPKPTKITLDWNRGWIFTAVYEADPFQVGDVGGDNSAVGVFNACHAACDKLAVPATDYTWRVVNQRKIEADLNI